MDSLPHFTLNIPSDHILQINITNPQSNTLQNAAFALKLTQRQPQTTTLLAQYDHRIAETVAERVARKCENKQVVVTMGDVRGREGETRMWDQLIEKIVKTIKVKEIERKTADELVER